MEKRGTQNEPIDLSSQSSNRKANSQRKNYLWDADGDYCDENLSVLLSSDQSNQEEGQMEVNFAPEDQVEGNQGQQEDFQQGIEISSDSVSIIEVEQGEKGQFIPFERKGKMDIARENRIAPWMSETTSNTKDSLLRLHNQIFEFYQFMKPSQKVHDQKASSLYKLQMKLENLLPGASVKAFGSFVTRLYLKDGDIDLAVLTNECFETWQAYEIIYEELRKWPSKYTELEYIRRAKVPIIKFVEGSTGFQFDISVNRSQGIHQVHFVGKIDNRYPEFKYLVFVIKFFLKSRGLSETYKGGVGSFLLFSMLLVYLQEMHRLKKQYNLGEFLIKFLEFYGKEDWSNKTINVKEGRVEERKRDILPFSCISPQAEDHDIGKAAYQIQTVFSVFRNRLKVLMNKNFRVGESILKELINPCSQEFVH